MLLHSLVDFNLRIPANAVFTAFLAAIFFHRPPSDDERRRPSRRQEAAGESKPPPVYAIPQENQSNPFAE